jgi:hypothetical protein
MIYPVSSYVRIILEGTEIMKHAKPIFMILIAMLICCSYSIGQPSSGIGKSSINSGYASGVIGTITDGSSVPMLREFVCNLMSACGMYPYGLGNNGNGEIVNLAAFNLGGVK